MHNFFNKLNECTSEYFNQLRQFRKENLSLHDKQR